MSAAAIEILGLGKWFGQVQVLKGVDLKVGSGERVVILGPSGSGKSTLIRCVNGLETYEEGAVAIGADLRVADKGEPQEIFWLDWTLGHG